MPTAAQRRQAALVAADQELSHTLGWPQDRPSAGRLARLVLAAEDLKDEPAALAVRLAVLELARRRPGRAVELRVPPHAAAQLGAGAAGPGTGPRHTRGTPPTVVEIEPGLFLELVAGRTAWDQALADRRLSASGAHADLADLFPLD
ncbi:MAG: sterol carrier family protein [Propionibacteriaceae bacterium]|jgi:hypothetical protein|nr:sterol carrier family protein [Propionibacteriaceae bacterium]